MFRYLTPGIIGRVLVFGAFFWFSRSSRDALYRRSRTTRCPRNEPSADAVRAVPLTLVVMAAGRGSRFGGMKQVAPLGPSGEALLDYAVYDARRSGFEDVVFVVSPDSMEAVEAHVASGCGRHVPVRYALQRAEGRTKPWGTGHAVLVGSQEVDGPFAVVNADDYYGARSFEALGTYLGGGAKDHALVAFRLRETLSANGGVSRGLCSVENGLLTSITELYDVVATDGTIRSGDGRALHGDELVSTNLWGFQPSLVRVLAQEFERFLADHHGDPKAEFRIGDAVGALGRYGHERVRILPTSERFLGVTFSDDVPDVRAEIGALVDAGRYPARLWP